MPCWSEMLWSAAVGAVAGDASMEVDDVDGLSHRRALLGGGRRGGSGGGCESFIGVGIRHRSVVVYDMLVGLPTLLFVAFLASRLRSSVRKLVRSQSHIMATYYAFLWLVCLLNVLRCSVQMWQVHPLSHVHLWNGLWLSTRFGMTFLEVSVVVFLAQGYHVSGHQALVRTVAVSGVLAGVDLMIKALLIYVGGVQLFVEQETEQPASYYWDKWGYWAAHEFIFALVYGAILVLPYTDWRDKLPARPSFYRYAACLLVLNALNALAALLVAAGDMDGGYCLGGVCNFVYYAAYPPLLYHTFLADFFRDDDTLELESAYYSEMRDAGYFDAGDGDDFDY